MSLYSNLLTVLTPYANKIKQNEIDIRTAMSLSGGAPIVVSSTSAMTDTDQIYVLSTDGEWYYHNGTAWVAGGEYGAVATDRTLTQENIPADAKATGDAINEVKVDLGDYEDITMSRSHNILPYESTSVVVNNVNVGYRNGKITINGTANNSGGRLTKIVELTLSAGEYSWYYSVSTLIGVYIERTSDNTLIPTETVSGRFKKFTLTEETTVYVGVGVANGRSYNETIDIIISDDTTKLYWLAPVQSAKDDVARTKIDEILSDPYYVKATSMTLEWEVGGIASNGNYNTNTNRLRTKYIIPVPLKMAVSGNYRFVCAQYDKKLNFIANYPSAYVAEVLPSDLNPSTAYIRFVLKRTDDASIGISEGNNLIATGIEEDNINTKKDISLAIYGDSISTYAGWIPSGNRVEYSGSIHGITNVNQTWWKKVVDYFGYNLVMNNSWSGRCVSTIRDTESGNLNSGGCEQANIDVIGSNGTPDIIIVEMGTNDINRANILGLGTWSGNPVGNVSDDNVEDADLTSFSECYARMIYRIHKTYPEAIVYCCTIMPQKRASINGWTQITQDNKTLEIWNSKIKEIADISGCRIIDFAVCGNTYINADIVFGDGATHPNGVGFLNMFDIAKKALSN